MNNMTETEHNEEDFELVLLAVAIIASILLGYRNKDKIKKWFDDALGKFRSP